jgi:hypothetical protein
MATLVHGEIEGGWRNRPVGDAGSGGGLSDADFRGCRWIEGEPKPLHRGMFCGRHAPAGESWCAFHRALVFWNGDARADVPRMLADAKPGEATVRHPPSATA